MADAPATRRTAARAQDWLAAALITLAALLGALNGLGRVDRSCMTARSS